MSIEDTIRAAVAEGVREGVSAVLAQLRPGKVDTLRAPRYLTTDQAAGIAAVTPETIRDWVKTGHLPEHRAGRDLRVLFADLEAYMRRGSEQQPTDAAVRRHAPIDENGAHSANR